MTALVHRRLTMVKGAAPVVAGTAASANDRSRRFVASTEDVDSYNTVIKADGWTLDRFAKNPIIQLFHSSYSFPVGSGRAAIEGKQLMVDVEFAPADDPVSGPDAEQCLRWLDRGVMGASVGFDPLEYVYNEARESEDPWENLWSPPLDFTKCELYEVSIVNVPSNPRALPVGRSIRGLEDQLTARFAKRLALRADGPQCVCGGAMKCEKCGGTTMAKAAQAAAARAVPALAVVPAAPAFHPTAEQIERMVVEATEKQVRALKARLTGNLTGG